MAGSHLQSNTAVKRRRRWLLPVGLGLGALLLAGALLWFLTRPAETPEAPEATPAPTQQAPETPSPVVPADPEVAALLPQTDEAARTQTLLRSARLRAGFPLPSWDPALFYTGADGRTYYNDAVETRTGIDVSEHQYDIDWAQVAAAGIDFAMIRLGYRGSTKGGLYEDPYYRQNMEGAAANGVGVGVYFYSQAVSAEEAQEEADFVLSRLEGYDLQYPVVFDWEIVGGAEARTYTVSRRILNDCAQLFCDEMRDAGYDPMIYFTQYLGYRKYTLRNLADYGFWYAEYEPRPNFAFDFDMWQYTCTGAVPGVVGEVDLNLLFVR